ncbi:hypothetical protein IWZ01DRAFT_570847 [Phyllosticta capitalensis]
MSDTEMKDVAKAVTPEPSSTKDKTPAPAAEGAGEEVPLPTFKQNEIELGFILFRCVKDNEIDVEKFMKLGGYSKSSVSTIITRLKKKIRDIEEAGGPSYKGFDAGAKGAKTPRKPRATATAATPKTPGGGKGKRKTADSDDEATPATPATKKPRASAKKVQKEAEDGEAGDDDVPETPVTPAAKKKGGRGKKAITPKPDGEEGEGEEPETPKTAKKPRAPRKKAEPAATPKRGGKKKDTAEPEEAGEASTDKIDSKVIDDKSDDGAKDNEDSEELKTGDFNVDSAVEL